MSVNTAGGSLTRRPGELARGGVNDIFAGLVASVINIAYGLSFAALIFAPPLNTWLAYGIAVTFITSAVTAAIVAARSSLPFAIAGPDPTTVAVTATLVSALVARLTAQGLPDDLLAPVAIIMGLSAALTGILLFALGLARAGGAADELGARLVLVNLSPELRESFRNRKLIADDVILADDLDRALESCEKEVIATHLAESGTAASLRDWLTQALGSAEYAEQLFQLCERLEVGKDTIIAEQGDQPTPCISSSRGVSASSSRWTTDG